MQICCMGTNHIIILAKNKVTKCKFDTAIIILLYYQRNNKYNLHITIFLSFPIASTTCIMVIYTNTHGILEQDVSCM